MNNNQMGIAHQQRVGKSKSGIAHCYDSGKQLFSGTLDKYFSAREHNGHTTNALPPGQQTDLLRKTMSGTSLIQCATLFPVLLVSCS